MILKKISNLLIRGFSLIELVSVIIIFSVLSAVLVSSFFNINEYKSALFYEQVKYAVRAAQSLAITSSCKVKFAIVANSFSFTQKESCDSGLFNQTISYNGLTETPAPNGVASFSGDTFYFDHLGRAVDDSEVISNFNIYLGDITMTIVGETGYVFP